MQDPFSQDSLSHTSFLLQDLSHVSFKKHTHTARSFLTRLTHIISTARSFSQDSIFNADSHIPAARPFLTRLSHTHSQYKIFLTRQSHSFIKAARPILTWQYFKSALTHSRCNVLSHKTVLHFQVLQYHLSHKTRTHTSFPLQDHLSHKTVFFIHHPRSFSQEMPGTLSQVSALTAFILRFTFSPDLSDLSVQQHSHNVKTIIKTLMKAITFSQELLATMLSQILSYPFFVTTTILSGKTNKQTSKTFTHQAMSQLHHPETFHTNCRLLVREDLFCFCIASVVHCFLLFCLCFLPPPAIASRNALLGAPATDSEGENGKDWNSIARQWKRTLQVWPLTRGVGQTAANPTKDAANCHGNGDFSLGFVARCLSAW